MLDHLALSESGFLFDSRTGLTYTLSKSGTFLLRALIDGADAETLPERLVATFDVEPPVARKDVEQFLFRLTDIGILGHADADDEVAA
ncbi:MAG: PqqD family protein [Deltaproteobacteria bacterium]|nr:MAG: PqqD family protein [Deltaproteobacteria bacterium]